MFYNCHFRSVEGDPLKSAGITRSPLLGTAGRQMSNAALQLAGGSMTSSSLGNSMGLSGLNNFMTSAGTDLDVDPQGGGDSANIDDVLSILQSNTSWETTTQHGATTTNITGGGQNPLSAAAQHNSMTHVSWSNMPSVNMNTQNVRQQQLQQQQQHRPLPLNIPPNRTMAPGMKSPISPGFAVGQRSPGFAGSNPQRRSPASYPGQMSPSPVSVSQRSPAAFINQVSPSSGKNYSHNVPVNVQYFTTTCRL